MNVRTLNQDTQDMHVNQYVYDHAIAVFPRPCADILVRNFSGEVFLMLRANQPCEGQWWFPGGRVYYNESRIAAANRKLREECAITTVDPLRELGTHDLFFSANTRDYHDITTLFFVSVPDSTRVVVDRQALDFGWFHPGDCDSLKLHPYVQEYVSRARSL